MSQLLSQLTIQIITFLLIVRLFNHTQSTIATSFLWLSYALPAIFIGPFASAAIDLLSKKKVLMLTNFIQSIIIFIYSLIFSKSIFLLFGAVLFYSIVNQFYLPAELSTLPSVVKSNSLAKANGLFFITQQASLFAGFSIASPLGRFVGFKYSLYICSIFLFLAFLSVCFLSDIKKGIFVFKNIEDSFSEYFTQIINGYNYIKKNKTVLYPLLLLLGTQMCLSIVIVNLPVIAQELIKIKIENAGSHIVLPAGLGAIIAAFSIPKYLDKGIRKIILIKRSIFLLSLCLILIAFLIPELPIKLILWVSIFLIILFGYAFVGIVIPTQTFLQEKTPIKFRGRVFGNYGFLLTIASVFPIILSGTLTELLGIKTLSFIIGSLFLIFLIYISRLPKNAVFEKEILINN